MVAVYLIHTALATAQPHADTLCDANTYESVPGRPVVSGLSFAPLDLDRRACEQGVFT